MFDMSGSLRKQLLVVAIVLALLHPCRTKGRRGGRCDRQRSELRRSLAVLEPMYDSDRKTCDHDCQNGQRGQDPRIRERRQHLKPPFLSLAPGAGVYVRYLFYKQIDIFAILIFPKFNNRNIFWVGELYRVEYYRQVYL